MGIDEDHPDNKTSLELVLTKSLLVDADNRVLGAFLFNERRMELTSCVKCLFSANPTGIIPEKIEIRRVEGNTVGNNESC